MHIFRNISNEIFILSGVCYRYVFGLEGVMGHNIRWDNDDKTVVFQEYTDGATKDDLYALVRESAAMIQTVTHTVHLIIDERKVSLLLTTADLAYIEERMPKNQGVVVIIVAPSNHKYKAAMLELGSRIHLKTFS